MANLFHTAAIPVRHQTAVSGLNLLFARPRACQLPVEKSAAWLLFQDGSCKLHEPARDWGPRITLSEGDDFWKEKSAVEFLSKYFTGA